MLHTPVCDLLGIQYPIIQAGMGPFTLPELAAAVSNAGGMGSLGSGTRTAEQVKQLIKQTREFTDQPFAVNFLYRRSLDEDAFMVTLEAKPRLISGALGNPGEAVKRAHDAGILVMHQVTTVREAREMAERGVDVIIAQGGEAGGYGGTVAALALIPQVVDAVHPIPVIAAGGIADGRGVAAALALGAQGVNLGTRFLASKEAPISEEWKQAILAAESEETIKVDFWDDINPPGPNAYPTVPRALHTSFIDKWIGRRIEARQVADLLLKQLDTAADEGRIGEMVPYAGQTVGLIQEILPASEIVRRLVTETDQALKHAAKFLE